MPRSAQRPPSAPTGAYLPEVAHPHAVFARARAGYEVDLASARGGAVPLDGVDRRDPVNAASLDDPPAGQHAAP